MYSIVRILFFPDIFYKICLFIDSFSKLHLRG
uniref:Uncharacterized protein n=1 Tax=Podoviridae sp. cttxo15 TaxID=2826584 RepID=A0A8S5N231_9CAUD|nr:MAG TPA: hypothetical protein [Podoviridae sp. cttxo15]